MEVQLRWALDVGRKRRTSPSVALIVTVSGWELQERLSVIRVGG
jgi:hypothetical protein